MPFCHLAFSARKPAPAACPPKLETLGDHLRKRRLAPGLLQPEVCAEIGVHEATIYNWENNRTSPSLRLVPKIIEFLGYEPQYTAPRTLGERIVIARRLLGLTQKELARRPGIDPSTLGRRERDEGRPSKELCERLNALLRPLPSDVDRNLL